MTAPHLHTQDDIVVECSEALDAEQCADWDVFLKAAKHQHPRQSTVFARSERASGRKVLYARAFSDGVLVAVGLLSLEPHPFLPGAWSKAYCLSGPICDDARHMASFLRGLCRHLKLASVGSLNVTPFWVEEDAAMIDTVLARDGWRVSEEEQFRETGWVDISSPRDEILKNFSKSARREVRRAERQGVSFRPAKTSDEFDIFLGSMNRLRVTRGLEELDVSTYKTTFKDVLCPDDIGTVIMAWQEDAFLAGLLVYRSKDVVHGRHFTTEPEQLRAAGNLRIAPALWLEAMCWAQQKGCSILDVEGYRTPVAGDKKFNIHKYKSEFGPRSVRRISEREKIVNRHVFLTGNARDLLRWHLKKVKRTLMG